MSELSFSGRVKKELCAVKNKRDCCERAECYGAMLFFRSFSHSNISFKTEYEFCSQRFEQLISDTLDTKVQITRPGTKKSSPRCCSGA